MGRSTLSVRRRIHTTHSFSAHIMLRILSASLLAASTAVLAHECSENFYMGDVTALEGTCEGRVATYGCMEICEQRVQNVFGDSQTFHMFYQVLSKPDCSKICNAELRFSDLIVDPEYDEYDYEYD